MDGRVHSIESLGTVDGPGIRFVVFLQGCPLRCLYCHNPDTWEIGTGKIMSSDEVLAEFNKTRGFYSSGGITVTGGEAMLQMDFLIDLFKKAKADKIHTCLDTSGANFNMRSKNYMAKLDELLSYTDLILLDLKEIDDEKHKILVGVSNKNILEFAKYLSAKNIPVWVRHVVIPTLTDNLEGWYNLGYFMGGLRNIRAIDVLPYHTMGIAKYQELGMKYALDGIQNAPKILANQATKVIYKAMKDRREDMKKEFARSKMEADNKANNPEAQSGVENTDKTTTN